MRIFSLLRSIWSLRMEISLSRFFRQSCLLIIFIEHKKPVILWRAGKSFPWRSSREHRPSSKLSMVRGGLLPRVPKLGSEGSFISWELGVSYDVVRLWGMMPCFDGRLKERVEKSSSFVLWFGCNGMVFHPWLWYSSWEANLKLEPRFLFSLCCGVLYGALNAGICWEYW